MKGAPFRQAVLALSAAMLLAGGGVASASASTPTVQSLAFAVPANLGTVQNLGDQTYAVGGGSVASAALEGSALDPGATVTFSLDAHVAGSSISGTASFDLSGKISGIPVSASGQMTITGRLSVAGGCPASGPCGVLPVLFGGASVVKVTIGGVTKVDPTVFFVENPYFNPFGAPIVLASSDGAVVIAATYSLGTIHYDGTMVGGPIVGRLGGSTLVTGRLSLTSTEDENLVSGTATDQGTIALSSMNPSFLDVSGTYSGASTIPPPGANSDCSQLFGFPAGSGVCTMTGFDSTGQYSMGNNDGISVVGKYTTIWTVPALAFTSTSTAVVTR